jgi:hypothetical protein
MTEIDERNIMSREDVKLYSCTWIVRVEDDEMLVAKIEGRNKFLEDSGGLGDTILNWTELSDRRSHPPVHSSK